VAEEAAEKEQKGRFQSEPIKWDRMQNDMAEELGSAPSVPSSDEKEIMSSNEEELGDVKDETIVSSMPLATFKMDKKEPAFLAFFSAIFVFLGIGIGLTGGVHQQTGNPGVVSSVAQHLPAEGADAITAEPSTQPVAPQPAVPAATATLIIDSSTPPPSASPITRAAITGVEPTVDSLKTTTEGLIR